MDSIKKGAVQVVRNCLKIKKNETVCIITDKGALDIAESIIDRVSEITDDIGFFIMEDFGKRPDDGKKPMEFPEMIRQALEKSDVSIFAAGSRKGELKTFRKPMLDVIEKRKIRHAHMIGITKEIMETGMCSDYKEISKTSKKVYDLVKDAKTIQIKTPAGTDLVIDFDRDFNWVILDGNITEDKWMNLPEGEVLTCSKDVNGTAVIDGLLGDYFDEMFGTLEKNPVTINIKNGRVAGISCKDRKIEDELKTYIKQDKNSSRIGEFAIGTNIGIDRLIGNMLQDEKFPGVHFAIGHGYPELTGSNWDSVAHVDCVMLNCTVIVDDKKVIMENSRFLI